RVPSETHSYELCLVGNLRDFGYAHPGAHTVHGIPVHVDAAIVQVSCGVGWLCFLTANGRAYSCGINTYGQLGQGHLDTGLITPAPLLMPSTQRIARISCGTCHGGIVTKSGALFTFGCGSYGRLGTGDTSNRATPTQVHMRWSALHLEAKTVQAAVHAGIPVVKILPAPASRVPSSSGPASGIEETSSNDDEVILTDISCGDRHTLVLGAKELATTGSSANMHAPPSKTSIISFGDGMHGRLGIGNEKDQLTGALISTFIAPQYAKGVTPTIAAVSAGVAHSAALTSSGELFTWGNGAAGQLGHGDSCNSEWCPRQVDHFKHIPLVSVKCGAQHSIAVSRTGAVYTWGRNKEGQLGQGGLHIASPSNRSQPQRVHLAVDPMAIQQMQLNAQMQAAAVTASDSTTVSAPQHQLQQQDLCVAVRHIVAKEHFCMALDEQSRLFINLVALFLRGKQHNAAPEEVSTSMG
uniref:Uncharacterized protein n=1 Tax=Globisporangium ultimum (strain ATCC 200006 / CBS 805.95 / DAOM BR144) TaxID=431595 RepID=K3W5A4_GLOUD